MDDFDKCTKLHILRAILEDKHYDIFVNDQLKPIMRILERKDGTKSGIIAYWTIPDSYISIDPKPIYREEYVFDRGDEKGLNERLYMIYEDEMRLSSGKKNDLYYLRWHVKRSM